MLLYKIYLYIIYVELGNSVMKRFFIMIFLLCIVLSGCSKPTMEISSLIHPPKMSQSNTKLQNAINDFSSKNKKFLYPIKDNTSPAYKLDVNNDGRSEAFIFYTSSDDNLTHILVLSPTDNDYNSDKAEWIKYAEITNEGYDIDFIAFENISQNESLDLIIGWKLYNNDTKGLSVYSYNQKYKEIYSDAYNNISINDINSDRVMEIFTLSKNNSTAKIIGKKGNGINEIHKLNTDMYTNGRTYISFDEMNDNTSAIIIDYDMPSEGVKTKIFTFDITSSTLSEEESDSVFLSKDLSLYSTDIDKDNRTEIFYNYTIPYTTSESNSNDSPCFAAAFEFVKEAGLRLDFHCIINNKDGYVLKVPDTLSDKLDYSYDPNTNSIDFYNNASVLSYSYTISPKLFTIRTFTKEQWDNDHGNYKLIATSRNFSKCYGVYIYEEQRIILSDFGIDNEDLIKQYFLLKNN